MLDHPTYQRLRALTFADAILSRLVYNTHRLILDGPSMRKTRT